MSSVATIAETRPAMDFDLYSQETIDDPWPLLARIRERGPIVRQESSGQWFTGRDKISRQILNKSPQFSVENSLNAAFFGREAFVAMDDKERHKALRGIWTTAFRPDVVAKLRETILHFTDKLIDEIEEPLRDGETADAMAGLCRVLPAYVIASMLGVSDDMLRPIVEWSDAMADALVCEKVSNYADSPVWQAGEAAKRNLAAFLHEQVAYRRAHRGDDLISQLVHSDVGKNLSDEAIVINSRLLLFAGNETTGKWLGNIFTTLADHPDDLRAIGEDRALLGSAFEEVMRWQPVGHTISRNIGDEPIELEGVTLQPGELVTILTGAAGRDPERHPDPDRFDIRRKQNSNLGFGFGLHNCLGVSLARLEAHIAFGRVLDRLPDYALVERPRYNSFNIRGPERLMIALA